MDYNKKCIMFSNMDKAPGETRPIGIRLKPEDPKEKDKKRLVVDVIREELERQTKRQSTQIGKDKTDKENGGA